jgi:ABC-type lipoprotein export system ATPase subunit
MQISLQQIAPVFLEENKIADSEIWNRQLLFSNEERIHIIASSGRGKTSLIHFLYGLRKDYSGTILYNNENINGFDTESFSSWRKEHISIVFQDLRLFPEQTVLQNLEIKRLLSPYHTKSRIEVMAKRLGIESKLNKLAKTCSYGEQQRISIIRSLQQPFDFLLLDEPFSHLDEANRKIAMDLMEEECALRKAAIILADLKQIEYFKANKIIHL